ncbi:GTPase-activating protein [Friedmanniomyces endolithicus]|nr:GTPase-activating protein [Friedmanniomyces endolithicus]
MAHALESEKQISESSSNDDGARDELDVADMEKTMLGQTPFPQQLPVEPAPPLRRLDSKPPEAAKAEKEEEDTLLSHLPEHEAAILKRQLDIPPVKLTYKSLYRYATRNDLLLMVLSSICAIVGGAVMPLMTIVFGTLAGTFQGFFQKTVTGAEFTQKIDHLTLYFVYLAIAEFVTIYVATVGFIYTGEHISAKIRENYLASILRQNIGYFDKLGAGEITTRITADTNLVQDGISEKVGLTLTAIATFVTAYVIGYIKYWKLTLILTSTIVAIIGTMGVLGRMMDKWNKASLAAYAEGGTVVEEVISSVRNATAFGTQDKLAKQYDVHLIEANKSGFKMKTTLGSMIGFLMCFIYLTYALAFWQGSRYLVAGDMTLNDILTILLSIMIGAFALGNVAPNIQAFATAIAAANKIYATIDRVSPLDPESDEGKKIENVEGTIELRNVKHIYPSRPEVVVMENVSLLVPAGKTTALVGASGSGKSTIVGLVERFYDPVGGEVLFDGHSIQDLNLRWLRQNISLVSQEPTLFATTIFGNIRHGLIGTAYEQQSADEVRELVENAARESNAHDFITQLPEGYNTNVGERGFLLSGGQKQRIAIARAIVSDPKVLLLDEATSALDTKSEGVVQAALDKASQGRTTIVIAHRLSTIKHADNIVVMSLGRIVEQGTHDELLERKAAYYNLVTAQAIAAQTQAKDEAEEPILDEKDANLAVRTPATEKAEFDYEPDPNDLELRRTKTQQSVSSKILAGKSNQDIPKYSLWTLMRLVASFNRQEWHWMLIGLFSSIINGAGNPVQAVFFAKSITALSLPPSEYGTLRSQTNFWSWMYFMLALVQLVFYLLQGVAFAYCSERLVHRTRDMSFRVMLRQDIQFFDREENTAGALTSFLSTETTHLAGMSGVTLGTILQVMTTLAVCCIISLAVGWKLALVCIATVPVVLGCGFFRFWMLARFQQRAKKAYEKSASYACEATSAIRTVASLTREVDVWEHYHAQLVDQQVSSLQSILQSSLLYAGSQSFMFLCIALGFWYGGTLIGRGEYNLFQFFQTLSIFASNRTSGINPTIHIAVEHPYPPATQAPNPDAAHLQHHPRRPSRLPASCIWNFYHVPAAYHRYHAARERLRDPIPGGEQDGRARQRCDDDTRCIYLPPILVSMNEPQALPMDGVHSRLSVCARELAL